MIARSTLMATRKHKTIGYLRVSTADQDPAKNKTDILKLANDKDLGKVQKKAAGMKLGRPKGPGKSKLDAFRPEIEALLANGSTQKFIARRYHTTEANLHNWMKKHGIRRSQSAAPFG